MYAILGAISAIRQHAATYDVVPFERFLISPQEIADRLGVSRQKVWRNMPKGANLRRRTLKSY